MTANTTDIRIAVVQALCGHTTVCGPHDFIAKDHPTAMDAAICWHLEAGYTPAACSWVIAELPPIPTLPELRAQAERGEFPKAIIEEWNA